MVAIVNNSSVKTVCKLQVMLSFRHTVDENTASLRSETNKDF